MKIFCKHKWSLVYEKVTESKFQLAARVINSARQGGVTGCTIPHQMVCAERKVIIIAACESCGAIKKFVEVI